MFSFDLIVSKEFILSRITEEQIFERYLGHYPRLGEKYTNTLPGRPKLDRSPGCSYFERSDGRLVFKDWAWTPPDSLSRAWDCFAVARQYMGCGYQAALDGIAKDFGLIDGTTNTSVPAIYDQQITHRDQKPREGYTPIQVHRTHWKDSNLAFWQLPDLQFTPDKLESHRVFPIDAYWQDGWLAQSGLTRSYGYQLGPVDKWQIYRPYVKNKRYKFRQSSSSWVIGTSELRKEDYVLMTKSKKDLVLLKELGYNACCVLSETIWLTPQQINQVEGFGKPILLFDNDQPGLVAAQERAEAWDWSYMTYPVDWGKDSWDVAKARGTAAVRDFLDETLDH
ncbi:hypothetical protein CLV58_109249 [Spirosoma oryzae]|uniref:Toprim domain-containing protein n=1 Tax=Spirosoma oryzae TaxID=1469603 RepID=A0A2T0SYM5_9BACT|nr:hypothetical protein [Spirosoma oryzae]PRY38522.1 hypothetical protein CLV58_109249 [Spirosoma oryzae]